jgi:hypothetical protein
MQQNATLVIFLDGDDGEQWRISVFGSSQDIQALRNLIIRYGNRARSIGIPAMAYSEGNS